MHFSFAIFFSTFVLLAVQANAAWIPKRATSGLQFKGADISSLLKVEAAGSKFKWTDGYTESFEYILAKSGANSARQRLWVNPSDGNYNLEYNVKLARRVKAAGMSVFLDLHYSDTWADPANQATPKSWQQSTSGELQNSIYQYTLSVCNRFASENITLGMISIGNEITAGMLWPLGKIGSFYDTAAFLHSAAWGIKDSTLNPKPKIMIHLDRGWDSELQLWWYKSVLAAGPLSLSDFDVMGVSYYPFYDANASLSALKTSLNNLASTYGKELAIAETNWPVSCPKPAFGFPGDTKTIPFSATGQADWVTQVADIVKATKGGIGLFYWEPAFLGNGALGSSCADNLMVGSTGTVRDSLAVFGQI